MSHIWNAAQLRLYVLPRCSPSSSCTGCTSHVNAARESRLPSTPSVTAGRNYDTDLLENNSEENTSRENPLTLWGLWGFFLIVSHFPQNIFYFLVGSVEVLEAFWGSAGSQCVAACTQTTAMTINKSHCPFKEAYSESLDLLILSAPTFKEAVLPLCWLVDLFCIILQLFPLRPLSFSFPLRNTFKLLPDVFHVVLSICSTFIHIHTEQSRPGAGMATMSTACCVLSLSRDHPHRARQR